MFCFSCKKEKPTILYSNLRGVGLGPELDTIFNLDNYKTLKDFEKGRYAYRNMSPPATITYSFQEKEYIINLDCIPNVCMGFFPQKSRNTLYIYKDSIVKPITYGFLPERYPFDSLHTIYKKDIFNSKKVENYSDSTKELVLSLQLPDSTSITATKKIINSILDSYLKFKEKAKDSLPLNITIDYKRPMPPSKKIKY